jgi:hypothetical protein
MSYPGYFVGFPDSRVECEGNGRSLQYRLSSRKQLLFQLPGGLSAISVVFSFLNITDMLIIFK